MSNKNFKRFQWLFAVILLIHGAVWYSGLHKQASWENVPPAPSELGAAAMSLGDLQLSYRMTGVLLQNLGNVGGRYESLMNYDYEELGIWFMAADSMDSHSAYVPYLAAYYYGWVKDSQKITHIIDYMEHIGNSPEGEDWRWLARAVVMARHTAEDLERTQELANKLAALENPDMPIWAKNMHALVRGVRGEKEDALQLARNLLASLLNSEDVHPSEINHMIIYICDDLLSPEEAKLDPVCQNTPI